MRDGASGLVDSAMNFLGVRYKLGGNTAETGFDCSGFTRYVFENSLGRVLPHRADEQANAPELAKVDQKDLKPGDLVFFDTMRRTFSHVGIYLGDGKFIHSPRTGESVRIEDINISYWARHFTGARRVPELAGASGTSAASSSMLASLTARLSGQPGLGVRPFSRRLSSPPCPPTQLVSLNPSGLRLGSTLPSLRRPPPRRWARRTSRSPGRSPNAEAYPATLRSPPRAGFVFSGDVPTPSRERRPAHRAMGKIFPINDLRRGLALRRARAQSA